VAKASRHLGMIAIYGSINLIFLIEIAILAVQKDCRLSGYNAC